MTVHKYEENRKEEGRGVGNESISHRAEDRDVVVKPLAPRSSRRSRKQHIQPRVRARKVFRTVGKTLWGGSEKPKRVKQETQIP